MKSTKQIPVHVPSSTFLMKIVRRNSTFFPISQNSYRIIDMETSISNVADILLAIMFKEVKNTGMEQDQNNHNLSITHTVEVITIFGFLILNHIFSCCNENSWQKSSAIQ